MASKLHELDSKYNPSLDTLRYEDNRDKVDQMLVLGERYARGWALPDELERLKVRERLELQNFYSKTSLDPEVDSELMPSF